MKCVHVAQHAHHLYGRHNAILAKDPPPHGGLALREILKFLCKDVQSGTATRPPEGDRAAVPPCTSTACNNNNNSIHDQRLVEKKDCSMTGHREVAQV